MESPPERRSSFLAFFFLMHLAAYLSEYYPRHLAVVGAHCFGAEPMDQVDDAGQLVMRTGNRPLDGTRQFSGAREAPLSVMP